MVEFNAVPSDIRVPFVFVEFDASRAQTGPQIKPYKILAIGQRTASGTVAELEPTLVTSAADAATFFGAGSMLHGMAERLFANNRVTEAWFVAQDDDGTGIAATKTLTVTGTSTAAGTVYLYIAGRRLRVAIPAASDANAIAGLIDAAVTAAAGNLPVTSGVATNVVTLTAKNAGLEGQSIDVRLNYGADEFLPAGVTSIAVANGVSGANNPDIDDVWPLLGEVQYDVMAVGYADKGAGSTFLKLDLELESRWGPLRTNDGVAFIGLSDTHANLITYGSAVNSKHVSVMGVTGSPTPPWAWAAAVAGIVARYGQADPARPFQTLELLDVLAPAQADRYTLQEQDLLLKNGVATFQVNDDGTVRAGRLISTYQTNAVGTPDVAFLDVTTHLTLGFLRWDFRARIGAKYARHKVGGDDVRPAPGQAIITPRIAYGEALAIFRTWEEQGLVEDAEQFKAELVVERDATDPSRLNWYLPPNVVNALVVQAARMAFIL